MLEIEVYYSVYETCGIDSDIVWEVGVGHSILRDTDVRAECVITVPGGESGGSFVVEINGDPTTLFVRRQYYDPRDTHPSTAWELESITIRNTWIAK